MLYYENTYTNNELNIISWVNELANSKYFYTRMLNTIKSDRNFLRDLGAIKEYENILDFITTVEVYCI